jgi:hypothetical protein
MFPEIPWNCHAQSLMLEQKIYYYSAYSVFGFFSFLNVRLCFCNFLSACVAILPVCAFVCHIGVYCYCVCLCVCLSHRRVLQLCPSARLSVTSACVSTLSVCAFVTSACVATLSVCAFVFHTGVCCYSVRLCVCLSHLAAPTLSPNPFYFNQTFISTRNRDRSDILKRGR